MSSTVSGLGKRALAWVVLIAVALIALKLVAGLVIGLVQAVVTVVLLAALALGVVWAVRHL